MEKRDLRQFLTQHTLQAEETDPNSQFQLKLPGNRKKVN